MRNPLKIVLVLLLLGGLVYGGAKGVMYWRVKSNMDELVQRAANDAEITYGGISTDLSGAASVDAIDIRPLQMDQPIHIERVHFASTDPWALIVGGNWQERDAPPPRQMNLDIVGVHIPLDAATLEAMRRAQPQPMSGERSACDSDGFNSDPQLFSQLGFERLSMDIDLEYRFDVPAERLIASIGFDLHEVQSVQMSVEFDGLVPEDLQTGNVARVALAAADMRVQVPRKFGDRYMQYCAQQKQISVDAFREQLLQQVQQGMTASGVVLGSGLQQAMADFYRDWGEMRLRVRPAEPLDMMRMIGITPDRLIDALGIDLSINDRTVTDLSFNFDMQRLVQQQQGDAGLYDRPELPQQVRLKRTFEPAKVASLEQFLGKTVKVKPIGQPLREGTLTAIVNGEAVIEQRLHGGSVTAYVRLDEIQSLQVERIERIPLN